MKDNFLIGFLLGIMAFCLFVSVIREVTFNVIDEKAKYEKHLVKHDQ